MSQGNDQDRQEEQGKDFTVTDKRAASQEQDGAQEDKCGCQENAKQAYQEAGKAHDHLFPKVTFSTFILSLSSSAMVHMGEVPEPETGQVSENLPLAKHTIDILAMLKEKTAKCLDADESRLLEGVLYELRMTYVVKTK